MTCDSGLESRDAADLTAVSDPMHAHLQTVGRQLAGLASAAMEPLASAVEAAWVADRTIFIAGNGGSAATASHFATDLSKTTIPKASGARGIRAVALTDNIGLLTAWANDYAYERVFAEQLRNLGRAGDLFVAISTSGESSNLIAAAAAADECGVRTAALAPSASTLARRAEITAPIDGESVQVVEDLHHIVCHAVTLHMTAVLAAAP